MVIFRHVCFVQINTILVTKRRKSEEGSATKTGPCQKFPACSFTIDGNIKSVDGVPLALGRYLLALEFHNRKLIV